MATALQNVKNQIFYENTGYTPVRREVLYEGNSNMPKIQMHPILEIALNNSISAGLGALQLRNIIRKGM